MSVVGIVIIGRNEGERLLRCLDSLGSGRPTVYVDSGSTDGSVAAARARGVEVVELDLSIPFTAARARNAGWHRLGSLAPDADYVQFVDGDCEVDAGWIDSATSYLDANADVVVVCGRRRERFPERSVYNRLCDLEWDTPIGEADACGGDALMRLDALRAVDGYRESMIAGEEPELCGRLRAGGGRIVRLDAEMTRHDAAMTSFRQWWTRAVRAGHAYAEGDSLTRGLSRGLWRREAQSTWFWGLLVPVLAFGMAWPTRGWSLLLLGGYVILGLRIYRFASRRWSPADARRYACFGLMAKFAHLVGMLRYWRNRMTGRGSRLIEYKTAGVAS
ncbi:MAG: glycosyltransferase [Gemmataceae bacterium]|nr:glycosyltransferase [Gemmataceae bacterium]